MTKEELEKEADKYPDNYATPDLDCSFRAYMFEASKEGYLAGAEPREKRIIDLETEVKEWKDKAELWCKTANLKEHNIMINKELEKENAELKAFINAPLIKGRRTTRKEFYQTIWDLSGQLTKAKEIIREFVEWATWQGNSKCPSFKSIQDRAEQFLNSEVEK